MEFSNSLIEKIFRMIQSLENKIDNYTQEEKEIVVSLQKSIKLLDEKINTIIQEGFPEGDLKRHSEYHLRPHSLVERIIGGRRNYDC